MTADIKEAGVLPALDVNEVKLFLNGLIAAGAPFIPPPYNLALVGARPVLNFLFNLIEGSDGPADVDWKDVNWDRFVSKMNVVERLQKANVPLTNEEIETILG